VKWPADVFASSSSGRTAIDTDALFTFL